VKLSIILLQPIIRGEVRRLGKKRELEVVDEENEENATEETTKDE